MNNTLYGGAQAGGMGKYAVLTFEDIKRTTESLMKQHVPLDGKMVWRSPAGCEIASNQEWNDRIRTLMQG